MQSTTSAGPTTRNERAQADAGSDIGRLRQAARPAPEPSPIGTPVSSRFVVDLSTEASEVMDVSTEGIDPSGRELQLEPEQVAQPEPQPGPRRKLEAVAPAAADRLAAVPRSTSAEQVFANELLAFEKIRQQVDADPIASGLAEWLASTLRVARARILQEPEPSVQGKRFHTPIAVLMRDAQVRPDHWHSVALGLHRTARAIVASLERHQDASGELRPRLIALAAEQFETLDQLWDAFREALEAVVERASIEQEQPAASIAADLSETTRLLQRTSGELDRSTCWAVVEARKARASAAPQARRDTKASKAPPVQARTENPVDIARPRGPARAPTGMAEPPPQVRPRSDSKPQPGTRTRPANRPPGAAH